MVYALPVTAYSVLIKTANIHLPGIVLLQFARYKEKTTLHKQTRHLIERHRSMLDGRRIAQHLIADGVEGIHSLTLSNAMHLSSWLGETVELPIDEDLYLQELNKRISTSKRKVTESVLFDATGSFSS